MVLLMVLAGCGKGGDPGAEQATPRLPSVAPHIHALDLNVRDDALLIGTHRGLYRATENQRRPIAVGERRPDIMGLLVAGRDHILGSGHPDPRDTDAPPNLGIVEFHGEERLTFRPIAFAGGSDFHILQASGRRIYAYDTQDRLMVGGDRGRWGRRRTPAPIFSLAADPGDEDRVVAATSAGLYVSSDGARRWTRVPGAPVGVMAWGGANRLYLVDDMGVVSVSRDRGRSFRRVGSTQVQPVALTASGEELYAALADATVLGSTDAGMTWRVRYAF